MESKQVEVRGQERRQYERVKDAVGLHVQRLSDLAGTGRISAPPEAGSVRRRDKYQIEGYAAVRRDYPAVASYIDELEERIRQLRLDDDQSSVKPSHKVSLSAGGIHFADSLLLHLGETVGITITLFPSGKRISADAKIISGNDAPDLGRRDQPNYRATFVRISDADRQVLDDHVKRLLEKHVVLEY